MSLFKSLTRVLLENVPYEGTKAFLDTQSLLSWHGSASMAVCSTTLHQVRHPCLQGLRAGIDKRHHHRCNSGVASIVDLLRTTAVEHDGNIGSDWLQCLEAAD